MNDDSLRTLWAEQEVEPFAAPDEADLDKLKKDARRFDRSTYWRYVRENFAGVLVIVAFGYFYFITPTWLGKLGCALTITAAGMGCVYSEWRKRLVKPAAPGASLVETLEVELRKVETQIDLLRSIFWWYLLPLSIGSVVFYLGVTRSTGDRLFYVLLVFCLGAFVCWLNKQAIGKSLLPLKQQIVGLLNPGTESGVEERVRMSAPRAAFFVSVCLLLGAVTFIFAGEKSTTASLPAEAQNSNGTAKSLEVIRMEYNFPALAAAFVKDGKVVEAETVGYRKAGGTEKLSADDKFHIGSITKSMTATVAAMLVEQGKISWTTTIGELFPELTAELHPQYTSVTLEQLLAHQGGAPGTAPRDLWEKAWTTEGTPAEQRMEFVKGLLARKPEATPGTEKIYSNQGYAIAGVMLEKASGQTWEGLMQTMLFDPLGMTSAGFGAPATPGKVDQPWGHEPGLFGQKPVPPGPRADNPLAIAPAGAVHCSIADLAKYAAFHLAGARGKGTLLKPGTFRKLHTPVGDDYALGWTILERDWAGGKALWHNGSNTMFYALVWIAPERNCAAVAATNVGGDKAFKACDDAITDLLRKFNYLNP